MGAGHGHGHDAPDVLVRPGRAFAIGIGLNLAFVAIEAWYGWKSGSLALLADAAHNLSDVGGLLLAWGAFIPGANAQTVLRYGGDAAFAAIAAAGAHAVMSGHVHVPFDELRTRGGKAMRMIGAGTLSTRLSHGAPASWRVITCERGGIIYSELRLVTAPAPVT